MSRRRKYAGRRRHPSSRAKCESPLESSSPMKYMSREETDLSDGVQAGAMRDEETGKLNWDQVGETAGKGALGALIGGPVGALIGMGKDIKQARNAKAYNEGFEDSDMDAMDDLDDMSFS